MVYGNWGWLIMDYASLWAEIQASPECAPHIVHSLPKNDEAAKVGDAAIATILSAGRTRIEPLKMINDGEVAIALGIPGGPVFLLALEKAAEIAPVDGAPAEDKVAHAVARQAWRSLLNGQFNIGNASVRAAIDSMVGRLLTAEQAVTIKALAEVPAPVSAADVSRAVRGPR